MSAPLSYCRISIDGHTEISFTEDVNARYEALGWHVQHVKDGNTDLTALRDAIEAAKKDPRPSLIKVRGFPSLADPLLRLACCSGMQWQYLESLKSLNSHWPQHL